MEEGKKIINSSTSSNSVKSDNILFTQPTAEYFDSEKVFWHDSDSSEQSLSISCSETYLSKKQQIPSNKNSSMKINTLHNGPKKVTPEKNSYLDCNQLFNKPPQSENQRWTAKNN